MCTTQYCNQARSDYKLHKSSHIILTIRFGLLINVPESVRSSNAGYMAAAKWLKYIVDKYQVYSQLRLVLPRDTVVEKGPTTTKHDPPQGNNPSTTSSSRRRPSPWCWLAHCLCPGSLNGLIFPVTFIGLHLNQSPPSHPSSLNH